MDAFKGKKAIVLGVSADDIKSHQSFAQKYSLPFPLLSDVEKKVISAYGVWKKKNLYGREFMGIERTTFLIDEKGYIQHIFPKVRVEGHTGELLEKL
jgi:peroxiredoxin Q/BCP